MSTALLQTTPGELQTQACSEVAAHCRDFQCDLCEAREAFCARGTRRELCCAPESITL